jgi:hypothetical protein
VNGETWEWTLQEYAKDLVCAGRIKALIGLGHINSEQWECSIVPSASAAL